MSATIGINDLKFVIFGAGHDYTLADSGDGEVQIFSHPFVPLNSVLYAGQFLFYVPDENGEFFDAVKDDIAHCTFTPDLGDAFTTEGDVEVKCLYHREYIYPEETLIVEKEVSQTIKVVNHGSISSSPSSKLDVYSDGYGFYHPAGTNIVEYTGYYFPSTSNINAITKISSIPWRANKLSNYQNNTYRAFVSSRNLTDISELAFADVSHVQNMTHAFYDCQALTDLSPLAEWDTSSCASFRTMFKQCYALQDISPLLNWNTSQVGSLYETFGDCRNLKSLHGLENWDVSNVLTMQGFLFQNYELTDISALLNWNTSKNTNLNAFLQTTGKLTTLHGLENWDVSKVTNMGNFLYNGSATDEYLNISALANWVTSSVTALSYAFSRNIVSLEPLTNWDVSSVTIMTHTFDGCRTSAHTINLKGLENWDVSHVTTFETMIDSNAYFLDNLASISGWNFASATNVYHMLGAFLNHDSVELLADWRFPNVTMVGYARDIVGAYFKGFSASLNKMVYKWDATQTDWFDEDGTSYTDAQAGTISYVTRDASDAENWKSSGSGLKMFDADVWSNCPTWN